MNNVLCCSLDVLVVPDLAAGRGTAAGTETGGLAAGAARGASGIGGTGGRCLRLRPVPGSGLGRGRGRRVIGSRGGRRREGGRDGRRSHRSQLSLRWVKFTVNVLTLTVKPKFSVQTLSPSLSLSLRLSLSSSCKTVRVRNYATDQSSIRVVESLQQLHHGALATPTGPDEGHRLPRVHPQVQPMQNLPKTDNTVRQFPKINAHLSSKRPLVIVHL